MNILDNIKMNSMKSKLKNKIFVDLENTPKTFWVDKDFVLLALTQDPGKYFTLKDELKNDYDVAIVASTYSAYTLISIPKELKARDNAFIEKNALIHNPYAIQYISNNLITKEMALDAVKKNSDVFKHLPIELRDDLIIVQEAIRENKNNINHLSNKVKIELKLNLINIQTIIQNATPYTI